MNDDRAVEIATALVRCRSGIANAADVILVASAAQASADAIVFIAEEQGAELPPFTLDRVKLLARACMTIYAALLVARKNTGADALLAPLVADNPSLPQTIAATAGGARIIAGVMDGHAGGATAYTLMRRLEALDTALGRFHREPDADTYGPN